MRRPIQFVVPVGVRDLLTVEKHEYFVCNLVVRELHEAIAYTIHVLVRLINQFESRRVSFHLPTGCPFSLSLISLTLEMTATLPKMS